MAGKAEREPGRPAETQAARAAPTAPAAPAANGGENRSIPAQAGANGKTNGTVRASVAKADRVGPESNRPPAQSRANGAATIPAARTDVGRPAADLPDGSLLQRFVANREQAAFTALVQRHEQFVLGVCRRVLGDSHAAQDAFQATFLVLARKAGMLDRQSSLNGWLYRVAYHVALRLRAVTARQRLYETEAATGRPTHSADVSPVEVEEQELRAAVREELERLPEKYRAPLEMCYFDGRTHADAAREIGLPRGSMAKRIGEGLDRLRERLVDRGFAL
jgi:RNA polymerase sigma factor (sigma-70 family)